MLPLTRRAVLSSGLLAAACGAPQPAAPSIAFTEADPHILVSGAIDGRTVLALVDNAAPLTSIDRAFAQAADLPASSGYVSLLPTTMTLGAASVAIHPLLEDLSEAAISADAPVTAILGQELFDAYIVELAFATRRMTLHSRSGFVRPEQAQALPLIPAAKGAPYVEITLGETKLRALLDLGCAAPLLVSTTLARELGLGEGRPTSTRQTVVAAASGLTLSASTLTSIDGVGFAGQRFDDVPIDILPRDAGPFTGFDVVVGLPLLRRFDLILDLPARAWITPTPRLREPFQRRYTGLQTRPEGNKLLIRHVAPGSPAATAGLRPGEIIFAIDGAPPLMQTLRDARPGQTLDLALLNRPSRRLKAARYY